MRPIFSGTALLAALSISQAYAAEYCGELHNAYGPFDYALSANRPNLQLVEGAHFTAEVENLRKGHAGTLGGDLDYTLRAFPNHYRALIAMGKLSVKTGSARPPGAHYSTKCYFERALRFKPGDGMVLAAYADYLLRIGEFDQALEKLNEAVQRVPDNASVNYNLGLLYLKKQDYAHAKTYAMKAYALGFPLPGLKNKLVAAGKWNDAGR